MPKANKARNCSLTTLSGMDRATHAPASKNFPWKRKGNLRKTFICFHISTCPPECCFEDITVNFQNRKQSLFHVEIKVLFGTTRFGFVVRHPRAGHVFGSGIATLVVLATRFG